MAETAWRRPGGRRGRARRWRLLSWSSSRLFTSRRRHTRYWRGWSSDVCSSDLVAIVTGFSTATGGGADFAGRVSVATTGGMIAGIGAEVSADLTMTGFGAGLDAGARLTNQKVATTESTTSTTPPAVISMSCCALHGSPRFVTCMPLPGTDAAVPAGSPVRSFCAFLGASLIRLIAGDGGMTGRASVEEVLHVTDGAACVPEIHLVGFPNERREHGFVAEIVHNA